MATLNLRNANVLNAILRKLCKENDVDINNVFIHPDYKYVVTGNTSKPDVDYLKTTYKGVNVKVAYISGCFYPYIVLE